MATVVRYHVEDRVALVTLDRPDRLNAITREMGQQYAAALDRAGADPQVRAVVVTGAGRGFCAGADMDLLQGIGTTGEGASDALRPSLSLEPTVPKPVIAAVNGAAAGLGFVRALLCDVRFASPAAKFTTAFARRGLVAEHGISWMLPRVVGFSRAMDLLLSARTVGADEAQRIGLVDHLVGGDVVAAAVAYAKDLATWCSPTAMAHTKMQVWRDAGDQLEPSLERMNALMAASFDWPDVVEGVQSWMDKREPAWPPLQAPLTP
jgi:enoyl-CoA hydratase/carnithine racemase